MRDRERDYNEAIEIILGNITKDRRGRYGDARENFEAIVQMARGCGIPLQGVLDHVRLKIIEKLSRMSTDPFYEDNVIDIAGYALLAYSLIKEFKDESAAPIGEGVASASGRLGS